jgi:ankyrin repeat protein
VLQHCFPQSIRRTLNDLPNSLDETYERVLKEIGMANRVHAHRLLQCLTVAIRPLRVDELAEILALDFDGTEGATPKLNKNWRWEDRQRAVLSACSSLITLVDDGDSRVIQFSHFSVMEFLTSDRLSISKGDFSHLHIILESAHTTLAQACLGTLLQLDGNSDQVEGSIPLARYASRHWVEHAQFGKVSSRIEDGMRTLFDSEKPHFIAWLQLHDLDDRWEGFSRSAPQFPASPLYYASLCGFRNLAEHIIVEHPDQVNARGGLNHAPLAAALHKGHFKVADLLHQHGAAVDIPGDPSRLERTPLLAASGHGLIDVVRWLLDHGANVESRGVYLWTSIMLAAANGRLEVVQMLLEHGVHINSASEHGYTSLGRAASSGYVEIVRLLLQHGADIDVQDQDFSTPLHVASSQRKIEVTRLLLDHGAEVDAKNKDGRTPLHLASSNGYTGAARLLLDHGANPDAEDKEGSTPLRLASSADRTETVRLLLERGASANLRNKDGKTPLQVAIQGPHEIVQMLTEHSSQVDREL